MNWHISVKQIRERLGWSQQQLAFALGNSVPTINRWEREKSKPSLMAEKLLRNLMKEYLFGRCDQCGNVFDSGDKAKGRVVKDKYICFECLG